MKTNRKLMLGIVFCALFFVGSTFSSAADQADLILFNGKIITIDTQDHIYQAVAVKDGKILQLGSDQEILALAGLYCKLVNLNGKTATPGLIDSHYHMMYYGQQFWPGYLNIRHPVVQSKADLLRVVGDYVKQLQPLEWISGNQGFVLKADETIDRYDLDAVAPNNPAYLRHSSGQFSVVNSLALQIAKIDKNTPNPHSSLIVHDSQGEPTGILSHYPAENLVAQFATGYGDRTEEQKIEDITVGQQLCLQAGYTSIQDVIIGSSQDILLYKKYAEDGKLQVRLYTLLYLNTEEQANNFAQTYKPINTGRFKFGGWKLAMDGGFAAKTILFYDKTMYASQMSYPYFDQQTLNRIVQTLHNTGLQVAVHVSGDEGIEMTLAAYEQAMTNNPRSDPRHRIEHGIFPTTAALQKMKELGVVLSTQPQWINWYGDGYKMATNATTLNYLLPFKTMMNMGIHIAFGCDVPASPYQDPKWAFAGAVARRSSSGTFFTPAEKMTPQEALRTHTLGSAYASFSEDSTGSIEPGKYADITVWSHDLYTISGTEINNLASEMTIVNGEILYDAGKLNIKYASGKWMATADMNYPREYHTATLLQNGKVLIVGWDKNEAELYDPTSGTFIVTGSTINNHRQGLTATSLPDGTVLIVGGVNGQKTAEIYDPTTGTFSLTTDTLKAVHCYHSATLLADGRVLIAGGQDHNGPQTHAMAEIYDPQTGMFTLTGSLNAHRSSHTATLLPNGQVLIVGGLQTTTPGNAIYLNSCEIYDPNTGAFTLIQNLNQPRLGHSATVLDNNRVLIAGGAYYQKYNELYDCKAGTWTLTGNMNVLRRDSHRATLLNNSTVMLTGGSINSSTRSVEVYDPLSNSHSYTDSMLTQRRDHTATLLPDGRVLVTGGYDGKNILRKAELYKFDAATGIKDNKDIDNNQNAPGYFTLSQNYPNPFNAITQLNYRVSTPANVRIIVYNLRGEKITTLVNARRPVGEYRITWDGSSEKGKLVGSGLYVVSMQVGDRSETRKVLLLK